MGIGKEKLVQKGKRGLIRVIFSRTGLVLLLFFIQLGIAGSMADVPASLASSYTLE